MATYSSVECGHKVCIMAVIFFLLTCCGFRNFFFFSLTSCKPSMTACHKEETKVTQR